MTPFQTHSALPSVGLTTLYPLAAESSDWSFMLNGCSSDTTGASPFNRFYRGNRLAAALPEGYYRLGDCAVGQRAVCLFALNPASGACEIGLYDKGGYRTVATDPALGFRLDRPIQAVVDEDFNGHTTVIWVQEDAPVRFMDLNHPPQLDDRLDVEALNLFRRYAYPRLRVEAVTGGGRLLAGAYFFSLQYSDENGNALTAASTPLGPVMIYRDPLTQALGMVKGSPDREPTAKAVRLAFSNLDTSFGYVNLLVVKSYGGIRSAVVAATLPTTQRSYLYGGNVDVERDILLEEVTNPGVSYSSAHTICWATSRAGAPTTCNPIFPALPCSGSACASASCRRKTPTPTR